MLYLYLGVYLVSLDASLQLAIIVSCFQADCWPWCTAAPVSIDFLFTVVNFLVVLIIQNVLMLFHHAWFVLQIWDIDDSLQRLIKKLIKACGMLWNEYTIDHNNFVGWDRKRS